MSEFLSRRAVAVRPSVTFTLSTLAKKLKAEGKPILDLSLGEPDMNTPEPVVQAARRALDEAHFHYTPTAGVPALLTAIAEVYRERLKFEIEPSMTMATQGAKQALFNALATVTDPGDTIAVLQPYWVSYVEQAHALGLSVELVPCPAENAFRPDFEVLRRVLAQGVKLLLINSPCNPTGAAFGAATMRTLTQLVEESGVLLVSDEIYEDIVYGETGHVSPLHLAPQLFERSCVVTGLSKGFAMTGWRVGFSIAPRWWTAAMTRLQGHTTSHIAALTQQAAITALRRRDLIAPLLATFMQRRALVLDLLSELPEVTAHEPEGAFYLFLDLSNYLGHGGPAQDTLSLSQWLLEEHNLVLVPGDAFGQPGYLRLSFAASETVLRESFERLAFALAQL
jgi:aspartate aminotransferase